MSKRVYQSPKTVLLLPDVLCDVEFPTDQHSVDAEIANGKKYVNDIDDDEDYETDANVNLWQ